MRIFTKRACFFAVHVNRLEIHMILRYDTSVASMTNMKEGGTYREEEYNRT